MELYCRRLRRLNMDGIPEVKSRSIADRKKGDYLTRQDVFLIFPVSWRTNVNHSSSSTSSSCKLSCSFRLPTVSCASLHYFPSPLLVSIGILQTEQHTKPSPSTPPPPPPLVDNNAAGIGFARASGGGTPSSCDKNSGDTTAETVQPRLQGIQRARSGARQNSIQHDTRGAYFLFCFFF